MVKIKSSYLSFFINISIKSFYCPSWTHHQGRKDSLQESLWWKKERKKMEMPISYSSNPRSKKQLNKRREKRIFVNEREIISSESLHNYFNIDKKKRKKILKTDEYTIWRLHFNFQIQKPLKKFLASETEATKAEWAFVIWFWQPNRLKHEYRSMPEDDEEEEVWRLFFEIFEALKLFLPFHWISLCVHINGIEGHSLRKFQIERKIFQFPTSWSLISNFWILFFFRYELWTLEFLSFFLSTNTFSSNYLVWVWVYECDDSITEQRGID